MEIIWKVQIPILSRVEKRRNFVVLCVCASGTVERLTEQGLLSESTVSIHLLSVSTTDTSEWYARAIEGHFVWDWWSSAEPVRTGSFGTYLSSVLRWERAFSLSYFGTNKKIKKKGAAIVRKRRTGCIDNTKEGVTY